MGKARRRDRTKDRANPMGKAVKPPSDPELAAIRENQILPIITDLTNPESKTRSSAAIAIANIIEDTRCRKLLLREQIVRILLEQTITDSALESKSAGWGILRNLAIEEEADFCIYLYRQDILTAIQSTTQNIITTLESQNPPFTKMPKAQRDLVWTLSGSMIGLIASLAEAQDEILEAITRIPVIINFVFGLLGSELPPEEVFGDTLACLASLTEDNDQLAQQIVDHEFWLKGLMQVRELGGSKAVAVCGVLHNIYLAMQWFDHNTPIEGASDAMLVTTLMKSVDEFQSKRDITNNSSHSSPDQILQLALEITASIATSLQEALEHANRNEKEFEGFGDDAQDISDKMLADHASDMDQELEDDASVNKELDEEEMDADMDLVIGPEVGEEEEEEEEEQENALGESQPTLNALIRSATPTILSLTQDNELNEALRKSAYSALNNIAWTISSLDLATSRSSLFKAWASLAQRIWFNVVSPVLKSNTADIALASTITSIAWAVARSVQGKVKLQLDEQRKFMALYQASKHLPPILGNGHTNGLLEKVEVETEDAFQGLGVKCIGVLGRLALNPAPVPLNREIGVFLLTTLSSLPEIPPADAVEALNQVFDIYADKEYAYDEAVFWQDGFYRHLEEIAPKARKMAKSIDKRKHKELRLRADEAILNLGRFLTYKRKEKSSSRND